MRTGGEVMVKFDGGDFLRAQAAGESGFHCCLDALGREHLFERLADSFEHGAIGGQEAVIEREARVELVVELLARLERQIVEVHGVELAGGRQCEEQPLAVAAELDHREEAGIVELFGASFHLGGGQARVRLEAGGREQLLLRVLGRALKADRLGGSLSLRGRSLLLRERWKRAEKKNSGNQYSLFVHAAPRLANRGCWPRGRPSLRPLFVLNKCVSYAECLGSGRESILRLSSARWSRAQCGDLA